MSKETIAKALRRLREKSGKSVAEVSRLTGKSAKTIYAWESAHGQPDAEMLMLLCKIYGVDNIMAEFREEPSETFICSAHEIALVTAYRNNPAMQGAVDKLLGIPSEPASDLVEDIVSELLPKPASVQK